MPAATSRRRRAFARADVVVPEIPGGRSDEPLDIGAIPLDVFPFRELNVGDRVPAITAPGDADGRPLDLAALRGKFVLLVFWATSHHATQGQSSPIVKATYDAFGRDPRLVIIGLNQDVSPELMRRYRRAPRPRLGAAVSSAAGTTPTRSRRPSASATRPRCSSSAPTGGSSPGTSRATAIQQAVARALGRSR